MIHTKQSIAIGVAVLVASIAAYGQDSPGNGRRGNVVEATVEAFGLTEEQVEQIREIRRERPSRGQSREEFQAWREEQRTKIQGVLTDGQKAKVAELEAAREKMQEFAGAAILGLTSAPGRWSGIGPGGRRGPQAGWRSRAGDRGRGGFRRGFRDGRGARSRGSNRGPRGKAGWRGGRRGPDRDGGRGRRGR